MCQAPEVRSLLLWDFGKFLSFSEFYGMSRLLLPRSFARGMRVACPCWGSVRECKEGLVSTPGCMPLPSCLRTSLEARTFLALGLHCLLTRQGSVPWVGSPGDSTGSPLSPRVRGVDGT
jgi:hypothetical protein